MIDAVLSYHTNPLTCGVAKFNQELARRLGVPCLPLGSEATHPLISVKFAEMASPVQLASGATHDLFLHDVGPWMGGCLERATHVYAANSVIANAVRPIRPDVIEAWCPSTVSGHQPSWSLNILTFGMAHKFTQPHFVRLKALLDRTDIDYTISVSTGIHEGSPWEDGFIANHVLMREIFGGQLRTLGFLADDALAKELKDAHAIALFFDPAARANNTTLWTAMESGKPVVSNLDEDSPYGLDRHVWDINQLTAWPHHSLHGLSTQRATLLRQYGWDALIQRLTA